MKYYAVTEDPRELYHYGRLGMKWHQHIFGDKPKSPGYSRALNKLKASRATMAAHRASVKKAREQKKYQRAVKEAQRRVETTNALYNLDQENLIAKQAAKQQKAKQKLIKYDNKRTRVEQKNYLKNERKAIRAERKMDKHLQEAREGRLKYGKLTPDQVERVQERLQLEQKARNLGGTEKPSWKEQKKAARRAGYLSGITKGTTAAMEELGRAAALYGIKHIKDRKKLKAASELDGKRANLKDKEKNKKSKKEIRDEFKQDVYKAKVQEGEVRGTATKAAELQAIQEKRLIRELAFEDRRKEKEYERNALFDKRREEKRLNSDYNDLLREERKTDKQMRNDYIDNVLKTKDERHRFRRLTDEEQKQAVVNYHTGLALNKLITSTSSNNGASSVFNPGQGKYAGLTAAEIKRLRSAGLISLPGGGGKK